MSLGCYAAVTHQMLISHEPKLYPYRGWFQHSFFFFFQAEDGIRDYKVTGVQTCALPICLSVTLVPVLMGYWIRGRIPNESSNPLSRWLIALYRPLLAAVLRAPVVTILAALDRKSVV